ncbi:MAG: TonB-dependent receptor [Flavobacteriaceae bacterium]|nr:TonB-dependent receptor [Flavobacteriaceae bacterium]
MNRRHIATKSPVIAIMMILLVANIGHTQQITDSLDVRSLDPVILTATRTQRQLSSLPVAADIITHEEINSINSVRLTDILSEQTGLITIPDFGGVEGVQIQGMDSQYTLVLLDGVPLVGRSAGTLDIGRITTGNIQQIEIIKGASSSLYGSDALGGVINIITQTNELGFYANVGHQLGSFNRQNTTSNFNYKKDQVGVDVFFNRFSSDGFDLVPEDQFQTVNPFVNYTATARFSYEFSDRVTASIYGRIYDENQENSSLLAFDEVLTGENSLDEFNLNFNANWQINDQWHSELEFHSTRYTLGSFLNYFNGDAFSSNEFVQNLTRPEIRTVFSPNEKNTMIGGFGYAQESVQRDDFISNPRFNSQYFYFQYDAFPLEGLNIIAGFRFDSHSEYNSQFSPKFALRYQLTRDLAIKGSVGYGFKAPDFRQLYLNFTNSHVGYVVIGRQGVENKLRELALQNELTIDSVNRLAQIIGQFNSPLKAESSIAYNVGLTFSPSKSLNMSANYFRNNISNLIETLPMARLRNGQNVFSYINLNEVYTEGLEYNFKWMILKNLDLKGGYQLLYSKDEEIEKEFKDGKVFARESPSSPVIRLKEDDYYGLFNRSRHMANLKLFYEVPSWGFDTNIRATYRSKYALFDTNNNTHLDVYDHFADSYFIVDFALNKLFFDNYLLGFGIDNLLDFTDPPNASNIAGRIFYANVHINL